METRPFLEYRDALLELIEAMHEKAAQDEGECAWELAEVTVEDFEPKLDTLALDTWSRRGEIEQEIGSSQSGV